MVIPYNKPVGKTSFSVVGEFKKKFPGQKIGYVGTLDPMAEGLLLMLTGNDTKRCEELVSLTKEYEFEVVFGVNTDTGDVLGIVRKEKEEGLEGLEVAEGLGKKKLERVVAGFVGSYQQTVPAFSAIKVGGRKLHIVSRKTPLLENDLPKRLVKISHIELLNFGVITLSNFKKEVFRRLDLLENYGNQFRKPNVVKQWGEYFATVKLSAPAPLLRSRPDISRESAKSASGMPAFLTVAKIRVRVSKGTYIRSLAVDIGKKLDIPYSMCLSIKRTKVGDYFLEKN